MYAQNLRQEPELYNDGNSQANAEPAPEMLVQYPRSSKVTVVLPEPDASDEVAAENRGPISPGRVKLISGETVGRIGSALELSPHLPWAIVASGLAFVAYLWSMILL